MVKVRKDTFQFLHNFKRFSDMHSTVAEPTFRLPFVVKALPHIEQPNGFSPVCVRSWICRALAEEKFFPHEWQLCCLGVRRGGGGASIGVMLGLMVVWGATAGTWMPRGRWGLSVSDIVLPCPFISILIMLDAVLARFGGLRPEEKMRVSLVDIYIYI